MKILLTIAWRNIKEHKTKTLIISAIMIIGITVLVVGNSLMDAATSGIEKYYTKNCTGHLIITGSTRGKLTLFGFQDMSCVEQMVPRIPEYSEILEYSRSLPYVAAASPQVYVAAMFSKEDKTLGMAQIFGLVPEQYQEMFPDNLEFIAGDFWAKGQEGVLINNSLVKHIKKGFDYDLKIGDKLLFTAASYQTGIKIREVEVKGIFKYKQSNPQLDAVCLMDISNVRALAGMVVGHADEANLSEKELSFIGQLDQEDIFAGSSSIFVDPLELALEETEENYWDFWLKDEEVFAEEIKEDLGAWQYLLVRLEDEKYTRQAQRDFAQYFSDNNLPAQTNNWRQGAGIFAELSHAIKNIFNVIVLLVAVVAVIIIMNTLVIAIMERMSEIGTMRAIGAQKNFVRRMIITETILLSGISGLIGIGLGSLIIFILNLVGLEANNIFFEIIFGGPSLQPSLSISALILSLLVIILVGIVSSSYPTAIVMRTSPLQAMESRGD